MDANPIEPVSNAIPIEPCGYVRVKELAAKLHVCERTIHQAIREGAIMTIRLRRGGCHLIPLDQPGLQLGMWPLK